MENELKQVVADLFEADHQAIHSDFLLSTRRMQGSLARAKLDAAIRHRLGVKSRAVYSAKTYGELAQAVVGKPLEESNSGDGSVASLPEKSELVAPFSHVQIPQGLLCGIDIEMVESLPLVTDYWKDEFYVTTFSSSEIAYCLLQEDPRVHFAGRWCAKEALKKCHQNYLHEDLRNLEVVSEAGGKPFFQHYVEGVPSSLPVSVSIAHTNILAVAMVVQAV